MRFFVSYGKRQCNKIDPGGKQTRLRHCAILHVPAAAFHRTIRSPVACNRD
jgi:hypothetical protein